MTRAATPSLPSSRPSSARWVPLALPLAILAISFAALFFRKAAPTHPMIAAGTRLAIAAAILFPRAIARAAARRLPRSIWLGGVAAGFFYSIHFGAWVSSLSLTSVAASVTLVTATPLLLALHAVATGRDRPGRGLWLALALAAVGVAIIGGRDLQASHDALVGDALALLGAAAMAGYLVVGRRLGAALDVWSFSGIATATGAVLLLSSAAIVGVPLALPSTAALGWIAMSALLPQLVGHSLLTWCLRHTRPTVVGMATVGEPVGATLLGFLWLGERVDPIVLAGCVVTLASVILALRVRDTGAVSSA